MYIGYIIGIIVAILFGISYYKSKKRKEEKILKRLYHILQNKGKLD